MNLSQVVVPKNKSVLVLSNFRSGSTALCNVLGKHLNKQNLDEDLYINQEADQTVLDTSRKGVIFKVQPDHVPETLWKDILDNCFVIGITRRNVVDQIASFHVCTLTEQWHNNADYKLYDNKKIHSIVLDDVEIRKNVAYILETREKYSQNKHLLDIEFYYEDIKTELTESDYSISTRPDNYADLQKHISKILYGE